MSTKESGLGAELRTSVGFMMTGLPPCNNNERSYNLPRAEAPVMSCEVTNEDAAFFGDGGSCLMMCKVICHQWG